jgi:CRISPR-associated endonuclease Csn1
MNKNITLYNNNKFHHPIYKVRLYEKGSGRFILGENDKKNKKYVQGAPNLFFGIYTNEQLLCKGADKKPTNRCFETIPLNIIIERLKQGMTPVSERNIVGEKLLFDLSPYDLVYVPTDEELENTNNIDFSNLNIEQKKRIFVVNDFSGVTCYFTPHYLAKNIAPKEVDLKRDKKKNKISGSFDTKTASFEGNSIKDRCIKLKVNRLGRIERVLF